MCCNGSLWMIPLHITVFADRGIVRVRPRRETNRVASKDQYEFFQSLYEEEERVSQQLEGRAKVYLSVITAFLVAFLLKAEEVSRSAKALKIPWWAMLVEALILGASLVCVVVALRIRTFEAVNDGVDIIEGYREELPTDEEFFEDRIADYAYASSTNRRVNDRVATTLAWAGWLLVAGMLFLLVLIILAFRSDP